jgi:magnesium chelatase family protein
MIGPPGTGKSMLAKRLPSILPPLTEEESIESSTIHSVVGGLRDGKLLKLRPFRAPHHTISDAGLVGGGHNIPKPGEITLAHNGVLFLDELPEFKRSALEVMRQPLENREVTISRVSGVFTYPAKFILIAAMNPCPCGHYGNYRKNCTCSHSQITRYRSKISGPLLDRIDLHIEVPELSEKELFTDAPAESSYEIRNRVMKARKKQELRFENKYFMLSNSDMTSKELKEFCKLDKETEQFIRHIIIKKQLSARSYDRILKVARTIADLAEKDEIDLEDITEAIQYRNPELLS